MGAEVPDNENHALAHQLPCRGLRLRRFARIVYGRDDYLLTKETALVIQMLERLLSADFLLFAVRQRTTR